MLRVQRNSKKNIRNTTIIVIRAFFFKFCLSEIRCLKKIFLMLIRSMLKNIKHGINGHRSNRLLFKYYVSKLGLRGWDVCAFTGGWGNIMENMLI